MPGLKSYLFLLVLLPAFLPSPGAEKDSLKLESRHCLKCHGREVYAVQNSFTGQPVKKLMNPYYLIDSARLMAGVHHTFRCTDCHAAEYEIYPHAAELKMMPLSNCLDCHGGDKTYAKYRFEKIEAEFQKSVHFRRFGEKFDCSGCHDQHYYRTTARKSPDVMEIVAGDNEICLKCHANAARFSLWTDSMQRPLEKTHAWLPNRQLHFSHVRCVECHTRVTDSLMVSHNILSREDSRQNCSECHSGSSILKASLYKYQNLHSRSGKGKLKAILRNESYVIGANQFPFLKMIGIVIMLLTLAGIGIHIIFRFLKH